MAAIPGQLGFVASASTVTILSQAGTSSYLTLNTAPNFANGMTGATVAATPVSLWATAPPDAQWISYADTGCSAGTVNCNFGPTQPPAVNAPLTGSNITDVIYQTFTVGGAATGSLQVWADDTATVWLESGTVTGASGDTGFNDTNATLLMAGNPNQGPNCASGPIGCLSQNGATISLSTAAAGTYTLVFDIYQRVTDTPLGVLYAGSVTTTSAAPEPGTYMLMGLALTGFGLAAKRRKRV